MENLRVSLVLKNKHKKSSLKPGVCCYAHGCLDGLQMDVSLSYE